MAHYAFLDENNIVTEVITGKDENELIDELDPETWYGNFRGQVCKRTSYNGNIRYNYATVGGTYDADANAFIAPRPTCGHKELFLNDLFKWNCQRCDLDANQL
jgi:hypothetical protein